MDAVFLVCLVGGLVATALLAALGGLSSHVHLHAGPMHTDLHLGGHAHASLPAHGHVHATLPAGSHAPGAAQGHAGVVQSHTATQQMSGQQSTGAATASWAGAIFGWSLSWLSPLILAAGVLCFGAGGLLGAAIAPAAAVPIAIAGAIAGAGAVRALIAAFVRAETPALQATAEGALGLINAPIREDCAGEVIYTLEGLSRSAPARTLDGTTLPRGARVVIVRRERGMAWVTPLDPLNAFPDGVPPPDLAAQGSNAATAATPRSQQASQD